jgi:CRISPR-associated protein Cas2
MHCLVLYDIPHDRTRVHIADACLDYGLERIQWSAFAGELNSTLQRELLRKITNIIGDRPARIRLFPLDSAIWQRHHIIEQGDPDVERDD